MMLRALNVCNVENGSKQLRRQWVANAFCVEQHREFACIGRPTTARRLRPPQLKAFSCSVSALTDKGANIGV
jgi:hypothetical protein